MCSSDFSWAGSRCHFSLSRSYLCGRSVPADSPTSSTEVNSETQSLGFRDFRTKPLLFCAGSADCLHKTRGGCSNSTYPHTCTMHLTATLIPTLTSDADPRPCMVSYFLPEPAGYAKDQVRQHKNQHKTLTYDSATNLKHQP